MMKSKILAEKYSIAELKELRERLSLDFKNVMSDKVSSAISSINEAIKINQKNSMLWITRRDIRKIIESTLNNDKARRE